ncbi:MAG TPA: DUF3106 domain-containing protein [Rhodocyclaceae bacterium]|nr:DUF3106 domain-containing protein [Rhodocyclaceae bacterium]
MARTTLRTLAIAAGVSVSLVLANPAGAIDLSPLQQPNWAELTPQQREVLMPLSGEWDKLETYRRKKWLGIAQRYPSMTMEEQQRVQHNMRAWIKLTPAQRQQARERFKESLQKASPEHRQAIKQKWQEYSELPDAEKERLRKQPLYKTQPKSNTGKSTVRHQSSQSGITMQKPPTSASNPVPAMPAAPSIPAPATTTTQPQPVSPQPLQ